MVAFPGEVGADDEVAQFPESVVQSARFLLADTVCADGGEGGGEREGDADAVLLLLDDAAETLVAGVGAHEEAADGLPEVEGARAHERVLESAEGG